MTNAHVISWAKQIFVKRYQDPKPYSCRVLFAAHDCDLAILEVEDESFFKGMEPLNFGALPKVRSTVLTYGFPAGGEQISYTRGVVSRIEMQKYAHISNRSFLAVQTDAAINPGNSGGPVIQEDLVVGVAFQGLVGLENTGFFIPPPIIEHFLEDIKDGKYDGFPDVGLKIVPLQNPAFRKLLALPDEDSGARIDGMLPIPSTTSVIKKDDVLLKVGPYPVANDGSILLEGNRVDAGAAFDQIQHGNNVKLKIWRDKKELELELPSYFYKDDRAEGNQYDLTPRYYIYGGLVFTPLSFDYLKTTGRNLNDEFFAKLLYELTHQRHEDPTKRRGEPVVLSAILSHAVNANFKIKGGVLVDQINGIRINSLEDVVKAFESNKKDQHIIEFLPNKVFEALDRKASDDANAEILSTYGVPKNGNL